MIKRHYSVSLIRASNSGAEYSHFNFRVKSFFPQDMKYLKKTIDSHLGENHDEYVIISLSRL
ncbi:hypothetical protein amad1_08725 [Alteromonas mediterranea DE1]|uniref:Uncharacterized protein n=1 Tax=Alteromonas mediterranea TaxID=314275 RepID=A0AAC9ADB5_9ALTE|nr:hypothetical protein amad1_08725 [Alteromonas mediterranea DE1]AGP97267.1 hypothetical protein I635_08715 [Alteromonas mediterranea UM7]AMJ78351.1 hypothetical protein AV942_08630 [Alteromonas mediterranea]AMJ82500.1 hypothetical protein AV941_08665 [Alteromonas mediterranea]